MKKMSKGMLRAALICGVVQWGVTPVHARELQEFALDEYVVTAARTETKLVDTPANISVVDAQTIEERHYQDVSEVLKDVPGANVIDTGVGAYEKVVRLNGDDRVLILVDGRRVNIDMGTMSRASFDLNQLPDIGLIERIEVLKGAGGALYGSDAVGGVINVITKKADIGYGKVNVSVGSNDYNNFSTMYTFKANKTGMTVSASKEKQDYYKFRDIKTDTTKRWHGQSDFENEKFSLKITQEINDSNYLEAGHDYSKYDGNSPSFSTYNQVMCLNKLEKETSNSFLKYNWTINESDEGYFQYYHNETDYANLGIQGVISTGYMNEKVNGIDIQQALSITDNNKIVFGTSWRKSDVVTKGSNNYDESIDNLAFFINDIWEFSSNWALNTGIRYDNHSEAGDETTFSLGLNKKISDNSHVYFNWGEVFKAPTTDDLFYDDGGYSFGNE
ncbi:MAG: TonB-dependent receptor, partial [Phascolarctobacterium sp.]|nr:TonB-dependent receptor [Phascolarctobacterium sp.]